MLTQENFIYKQDSIKNTSATKMWKIKVQQKSWNLQKKYFSCHFGGVSHVLNLYWRIFISPLSLSPSPSLFLSLSHTLSFFLSPTRTFQSISSSLPLYLLFLSLLLECLSPFFILFFIWFIFVSFPFLYFPYLFPSLSVAFGLILKKKYFNRNSFSQIASLIILSMTAIISIPKIPFIILIRNGLRYKNVFRFLFRN